MPQTLLALLALLIVSYLSFSSNRHVVDAQRGMIANELEVMATGVALRAMETIRTRAFDQAVLDQDKPTKDDFEYKNSTDHFYVTSGGCKVFGGSQDCDAIDDFHTSAGTQPATLYFDMQGQQIPFEVRTEVQYVDADSLDRYNGRTYHKEVTVYVQDKRDQGQPFLYAPVQMSRTFSYNFVTGNTTQSDDSGGTDQSGGEGNDQEASVEDFLNHLLDKYSDKGWKWVYKKAKQESGWLRNEYQAWRATRD